MSASQVEDEKQDEEGTGSPLLSPTDESSFIGHDGKETWCEYVRYADSISFTDENGEKHSLFIPFGQLETTRQLAKTKD
jgi:hypothetical protein